MIEYEGKLIYVKLNSGRYYNGNVIEVSFLGKDIDGVNTYMITIKDKYDKFVSFSNKDINFIEEKQDE